MKHDSSLSVVFSKILQRLINNAKAGLNDVTDSEQAQCLLLICMCCFRERGCVYCEG